MYFVVKPRGGVMRSEDRCSTRVGRMGWGVISLCKWIRQVKVSDVGNRGTGEDVG